MVSASLLSSVEFYVIAAVICALVVAVLAVPQRRGPVRQHLLAGRIEETNPDAPVEPPAVEWEVDDDGVVTMRRYGLNRLSVGAAASVAIEVKGFDVKITERLTDCKGINGPDVATFRLDFLAPEYYHVTYEVPSPGRLIATTLHVRPGIRVVKLLSC